MKMTAEYLSLEVKGEVWHEDTHLENVDRYTIFKIIVKSEITLFGRNEDKQKRKATKMLAQ